MNYKNIFNIIKTKSKSKFKCSKYYYPLREYTYNYSNNILEDYYCNKCEISKYYDFFEKDMCCICLKETFFKTTCKHTLCPNCYKILISLDLDNYCFSCPLCRELLLEIDCHKNDLLYYDRLYNIKDNKYKLYFKFDKLLLENKFNKIFEILDKMDIYKKFIILYKEISES